MGIFSDEEEPSQSLHYAIVILLLSAIVLGLVMSS